MVKKPSKKITQSSHSLSLRQVKRSPATSKDVPVKSKSKSPTKSKSKSKSNPKKVKLDESTKENTKTKVKLKTPTKETSLESNTSATLRKCIGYINFVFFFIENFAFLFISAGIYKALKNDCYEKDGIKKKYVGMTYTCSGLTFVSQSPSFVEIILIVILIASFFHVTSFIFAAYGFWFSSSFNVKAHAFLLIPSTFVLLVALLFSDILETNLNSYFNLSGTIAIASLVTFTTEITIYMVSLILFRFLFKFSQTSEQ